MLTNAKEKAEPHSTIPLLYQGKWGAREQGTCKVSHKFCNSFSTEELNWRT